MLLFCMIRKVMHHALSRELGHQRMLGCGVSKARMEMVKIRGIVHAFLDDVVAEADVIERSMATRLLGA